MQPGFSFRIQPGHDIPVLFQYAVDLPDILVAFHAF
jgi:hypothetical protein